MKLWQMKIIDDIILDILMGLVTTIWLPLLDKNVNWSIYLLIWLGASIFSRILRWFDENWY